MIWTLIAVLFLVATLNPEQTSDFLKKFDSHEMEESDARNETL